MARSPLNEGSLVTEERNLMRRYLCSPLSEDPQPLEMVAIAAKEFNLSTGDGQEYRSEPSVRKRRIFEQDAGQ